MTDFADLEYLSLPSAHTVLFLAVDAQDVSNEDIARVARCYLAAGLTQVCVWGPGCERVHDIFDEVHIGDGSSVPAFTLMSTWHNDETMEEALWYFTHVAFALDTEIETTSYVAITVGNTVLAAAVEQALSNLCSEKAP